MLRPTRRQPPRRVLSGPSVLEVVHRDIDTGESAAFELGARLFSNRPTFKISEPPAEPKGQPFLRARIDGVHVRSIGVVTVTVLTRSTPRQNISTCADGHFILNENSANSAGNGK